MSWLTKLGNLLPGKKNFAIPATMNGLTGSPLVSLTGSPSLAWKSPTASASANWVSRNITEPALVCEQLVKGQWDAVEGDPIIDTLLTPVYRMRDYGVQVDQTPGQRLSATAVDLLFYGNAYWLKVRNDSGAIVAYEWLPALAVLPNFERGGSWIRDYRVSIVGRVQRTISPQDIVHIRSAVPDPQFSSMGLAPINGVGDALAQDAIASAYMKKAMSAGGTGVIGSPEETMPPEIVDRVNKQIKESMALGKVFQMIDARIKLDKLGYSPEQMALNIMVTSAQSAICAAIGVMPQTLGIQAGDKTSTYSNVEQANKQSAMNCLGPMWDAISDAITYQALETPNKRVRFNWGAIQALQESENDKWKRASDTYKAGVLDRAQAKAYIGYEFDQSADQGFYSYMERLPQPSDVALPSMLGLTREQIERLA